MDNDLDRSVRMLEDALSTTNRGLFKLNINKHTKSRSSLLKAAKDVDLSISLNPGELTNILNRSNNVTYNDTMAILMDDTIVRGAVIQTAAPWQTTLDSLYMEFFEVLQSHSGGHDILDILANLSRCCADALKVVQGMKEKVVVSEIEEEKWLENERNTWRLLYILYQDRLLSAQNGMDDEMQQYFGRSEKLCVQNLFKRDNLIRESQLVIDWLEANAASKFEQEAHFNDNTVGWENTLHQLQSKDTIAFGSSRKIVTEMDPDAVHHQKLPLHDLDMDDEKRLLQRIFREIRCGNLEEAQTLCRQCGHSWRAAMFEGWRLLHDPNVKENWNDNGDPEMEEDDGFSESNQQQEIEGNASRDIWKNMAIKYCKLNYLNAFEKAAMAAYCGYLEGILPVCNDWEDTLWAYMRTIVDVRVEREIRECVTRFEPYASLPTEYWAQMMSLNEVFNDLESSKRDTVRRESQLKEHIIQKYIILDEIPRLLQCLDEWVDNPAVNPHFLRFAAHLALFIDQVGVGLKRDSVQKVLEAYIKHLMDMKETQLVAYYVGKANLSSQVHLYASYLEHIVDNEMRKQSLQYAEDSNLDVYAITKQVVENIRNYPHDVNAYGDLQHKLTESDKVKISALDWILFYENQQLEALKQTNALIFTFLTLSKLDAAQLAFNKIPVQCLQDVLPASKEDARINRIVKEFLSYKAYLNAHEAFNEWFRQSCSRPQRPADLPETAQFAETVAHQHRMSQFKAETERWKLTMEHLSKTAKSLLYNVLLFPEGWLADAGSDSDYLRSKCIPEIVLLLYTVLYESEMYEEAVQLADTIASEKYGLYKVYSKEKLGEILEKLCESSVALLNAKKDPWGSSG